MKPKTLKGKRILLKPIAERDISFLCKMAASNKVYKYEEDTKPSLERCLMKYVGNIEKMRTREGEFFSYIILNELKAPVGEVHLCLDNTKTRSWEVGFALSPVYWGIGYATESVKTILEFAFDNLGAHRVYGCCNALNIKSSKCMERAGMVKEAQHRESRLLRGEWCDELVYSILEQD